MSIVSHLQLEEKTECRKEDTFRKPAIVAAGVLYFHQSVVSGKTRARLPGRAVGGGLEMSIFIPFFISGLPLCDGLSDIKRLHACWEERVSMLCQIQQAPNVNGKLFYLTSDGSVGSQCTVYFFQV